MKTSMHTLGEYIANKYRHRANMVGVRAVSQQLRKQGFSLDMALLILLGARERVKGAAYLIRAGQEQSRIMNIHPSWYEQFRALNSSEATAAQQEQMRAMQNVAWNAADWNRQQNAHSFGNPGWLFGIRAAGL